MQKYQNLSFQYLYERAKCRRLELRKKTKIRSSPLYESTAQSGDPQLEIREMKSGHHHRKSRSPSRKGSSHGSSSSSRNRKGRDRSKSRDRSCSRDRKKHKTKSTRNDPPLTERTNHEKSDNWNVLAVAAAAVAANAASSKTSPLPPLHPPVKASNTSESTTTTITTSTKRKSSTTSQQPTGANKKQKSEDEKKSKSHNKLEDDDLHYADLSDIESIDLTTQCKPMTIHTLDVNAIPSELSSEACLALYHSHTLCEKRREYKRDERNFIYPDQPQFDELLSS